MTDLTVPTVSTGPAAAVAGGADLDRLRAQVPAEGDPVRMLPAVAYTSPEVLAWERRHLMAGSWTCLGRLEELLPAARGAGAGGTEGRATTQRAVVVGDVRTLLVRDPAVTAGPGGTGSAPGVRMFANTCRHRGHELLAEGESSARASILCPYHAWTYRLDGSVLRAPGFAEVAGFSAAEHGLVELPVRVWAGWVFGHAIHPVGSPEVPSFEAHLGEVAGMIEAYHPERLSLADRHSYAVEANWKVVAENYHECYHCPLIHPELCRVTPPDSGDNYDLPGAWVGGAMVLRDQMASMSMTGEAVAPAIPGVDPTRVEYLHVLPNLLVSAHPDYVMTHRLVPLAPDRTWIECSWYALPSEDGPSDSAVTAAGAVEFWDLTNRQDWAACESVQRGLASPHFAPGMFAPNEDAVDLVRTLGRAYHTGSLL